MPPYCDKHKMHYEMVHVNGFPWQECVCTACEFEKESGFNLMPQAPETTEILNEVKADKGLILTEEEIQTIESDFNLLLKGKAITRRDHGQVEDLIASHRILFSANAELSFKNMLLKAAYNKLLKETNPCKTQSLYPSLNTE